MAFKIVRSFAVFMLAVLPAFAQHAIPGACYWPDTSGACFVHQSPPAVAEGVALNSFPNPQTLLQVNHTAKEPGGATFPYIPSGNYGYGLPETSTFGFYVELSDSGCPTNEGRIKPFTNMSGAPNPFSFCVLSKGTFTAPVDDNVRITTDDATTPGTLLSGIYPGNQHIYTYQWNTTLTPSTVQRDLSATMPYSTASGFPNGLFVFGDKPGLTGKGGIGTNGYPNAVVRTTGGSDNLKAIFCGPPNTSTDWTHGCQGGTQVLVSARVTSGADTASGYLPNGDIRKVVLVGGYMVIIDSLGYVYTANFTPYGAVNGPWSNLWIGGSTDDTAIDVAGYCAGFFCQLVVLGNDEEVYTLGF